MTHRLSKALPYFVVLIVAVMLFFQLGNVSTAGAEGGISPRLWPRTILGLMAIVCVYEILKRVLSGRDSSDTAGVLETVIEKSGGEPAAAEALTHKSFRHLLWIGVGVTIAYVALIETFGFFLSTFLYLAVFMLVGRFRRVGVVTAVALVGSLVFNFIFTKVVYVSLPLGEGPFKQLSLLLMQLTGVR